MRRLLRELLKQQLSFNAPLDIVVRVRKTFSKDSFKKVEDEIKIMIKSLPLWKNF